MQRCNKTALQSRIESYQPSFWLRYVKSSLLIILKALESKQFRSTALYSILLDCKIMLKIIPA